MQRYAHRTARECITICTHFKGKQILSDIIQISYFETGQEVTTQMRKQGNIVGSCHIILTISEEFQQANIASENSTGKIGRKI